MASSRPASTAGVAETERASSKDERQRRARAKQRRFAVLVCGSRDWTDEQAVRRRLVSYPAGTLVIHGDCPTGADAIADRLCSDLGLCAWPVPYLYEFQRGGGPRRNALMLGVLLALRPIYTLAVEAFDLGGPGTRDMLQRARGHAGVNIVVTDAAGAARLAMEKR